MEEIEGSICLVGFKREKDDVVTGKRSQLEIVPVEVQKIAEPTHKKAKLEDPSKEEEGEQGWEEEEEEGVQGWEEENEGEQGWEEENEGEQGWEEEEEEESYKFLMFVDSLTIRSHVSNYATAYQHLNLPKRVKNPFGDKRREEFNKVMWNKEEEEDEDMWSTDSERGGEVMWSIDSERGGRGEGEEGEVNQNIRKGKMSFSSQLKSWKLVACRPSKEEQTSDIGMTIFNGELNQEEEKKIWYPYDDYQYLDALRLKRIEEFCEHLLKRPDIKDLSEKFTNV